MLPEKRSCGATYKVLMLGDRGAGKTSILHSLATKQFQETTLPTVGADFVRKRFEVDEALIELMICEEETALVIDLTLWSRATLDQWQDISQDDMRDSTGQEQFRSFTKQHYKGVQGLMLVYDVTCKASLETLKYWMESVQSDIKRAKGHYEPIPIVVCGNKSDLFMSKEVSSAKGKQFSEQEMAFEFFETSAKTGENVHTAFHSLAYHITDICNPKLMKSYHPYSIIPMSEPAVASTEVKKLRKFKGRNAVKDRTAESRSEVTLRLGEYPSCRYLASPAGGFVHLESGGKQEETIHKKTQAFCWCVCF